MRSQACARCGHDPACGYATVGDRRYCHDDACASNQPTPGRPSGVTCYMEASYAETLSRDPGFLRSVLDIDLAAIDREPGLTTEQFAERYRP